MPAFNCILIIIYKIIYKSFDPTLRLNSYSYRSIAFGNFATFVCVLSVCSTVCSLILQKQEEAKGNYKSGAFCCRVREPNYQKTSNFYINKIKKFDLSVTIV